MRVQTLFLFCVALISVTEILSGAVASKPSQKPMEQNTRLQIFLDNANFGPGKIDGRQGEFTKRALALFRQSKGLPQAVSHNPKAPLDMTGLDLSGIEPVFVSYTITADDAANVGELPKDPQGQAKMKRLPYATLAEAVAERFHCGIDFLKQFNPQKKNLAVGDSLTVPNVKPFELIETRIIE